MPRSIPHAYERQCHRTLISPAPKGIHVETIYIVFDQIKITSTEVYTGFSLRPFFLPQR